MCSSYAIDPEEFVDIFIAFVINNMKGGDISESTLDDFERKELSNQKSITTKSKNASKTQRNMDMEFNEIGSDGEGDDVMGAYIGCTTPKVSKLDTLLSLY